MSQEIEKAKQKKINEIIISSFKSFFPYKEFTWQVNEKTIDAKIDNIFYIENSHLGLGKVERIRFKKDFNFEDEKLIFCKKRLFEFFIQRHKLLERFKNYIETHKEEFSDILNFSVYDYELLNHLEDVD